MLKRARVAINELPERFVAQADEERRMRRLRRLVDLATVIVRTRAQTAADAAALVEVLRGQVLRLFPGKGETFDLIYRPRFRRLIDERFGPE